jgi:ABC-type multidrug transport system fused ATPase/permease subunit
VTHAATTGSTTPRSPIAALGKTLRVWGQISPFIAGSRWKMTALSSMSVVAGLSEAALLALVAALATVLSEGRDSVRLSVGPLDGAVSLGVAFAVALGLAIGRGTLQVYLAYLPATMSAQAMTRMRRMLFDSFLSASWGVKAAQRDGHFQSLMNAHVTASAQGVITMATGITAGLMFLSMLASAFVLSAWTALLLLVFSSGLFIALRPLSKRLRRRANELSKESVEYSKGVQEVVLMAEETEVFGATPRYRDSFYRLIDRVRLPLQRTRFMSRAMPALYQSIALLLLVLALAGVAVVGATELATLGAVVLILVRSLSYGQQMQAATSGIDEVVPFMTRLSEAISDYRTNARRDGGTPLPTIWSIGMNDVRFAYPGGPEVLHGLDFEVRQGESIGLVGPSGSGKSSVVQLILRLREPTHGQVTINGANVTSFSRDDWQKKVAYVPQMPQVIWGSVADNIRFYRDGITQQQIEAAAKRANLHDEIMSWPDGYDTVIGQRAAAISGGQRQRLCIARALAGEPDVLVLDEATSALDVRSEALVQETLTALQGHVTLFIVAHRLTTLSFCDRIMVLVDGRIDGFDAPGGLLVDNEFYRDVTAISQGGPEPAHGHPVDVLAKASDA